MKVNEDVERIIMLMEEISIAEKKLKPQTTGHIHTAISWLEDRVNELKGIYDR